MADIQKIFDRMELLDQELDLQSGEADVTRGLIAVNMAQSYFESLVAMHPGLLGDSIGTVTTAASTESTTFPSTVLRLDSLWFIDPDDSLPRWRLTPLYSAGEHRGDYRDPVFSLTLSAGSEGRPRAYWTDGSNIYWNPIPDATHTVRWYGFSSATDYTAAGDTFAYHDIVMGPMAAMGVKLFQYGFGDNPNEYTRLANELFGPVIETLSNFRREGPRPVRTADMYT